MTTRRCECGHFVEAHLTVTEANAVKGKLAGLQACSACNCKHYSYEGKYRT